MHVVGNEFCMISTNQSEITAMPLFEQKVPEVSLGLINSSILATRFFLKGTTEYFNV